MKKLIAAISISLFLITAAVAAQDATPQAELSPLAKTYLEDLVREKLKAMSLVRIESGEIQIHHKSNATLRNTASCPSGDKGKRGDIRKYVKFFTYFEEIPNVVLSLTLLDHVIDQGKISNLRINAEVVMIEKEGFYYDLNTWCNTDIWSAKASWIAYGN